MDELITLHQGDKSIELPLINLLRLTMVHLTKMLPEYYEQSDDKTISGFWKWIESKIGMGKGTSVLM